MKPESSVSERITRLRGKPAHYPESSAVNAITALSRVSVKATRWRELDAPQAGIDSSSLSHGADLRRVEQPGSSQGS